MKTAEFLLRLARTGLMLAPLLGTLGGWRQPRLQKHRC